MSRSYRSEHVEEWSPEFFHGRNKNTRSKNKNKLRTLLANKDFEDVDDEIYPIKNKPNKKYDSWDD